MTCTHHDKYLPSHGRHCSDTVKMWHPDRESAPDKWGMVLGPNEDGEGYPILAQGVTFDEAAARFPNVVRAANEIPVVVDVPS